ncbi:MAG: dihydroorotase family protein [Thermoplasmatota archaeon]
MDLTIEGKAFIDGSFQQSCIGIDNGRIVSIKKTLKADNHHTFGNKLILPGGIDIHVHFRDPGYTYKEDFQTGSKSAIHGGITCIFDMPNTIPQTTTKRNIIQKITIADKKSYTDFGIYAGLTANNLKYIDELCKYCNGFKIFLGNTTDSLMLPSNYLSDVFQKMRTINKPVLIHAEDETCLEKNRRPEYNLKDHLSCRPSSCEEQAIIHVLNKSSTYNIPIHICHLSSCEGFERLRYRRDNISVGTTPHHLFFDIDSIRLKETLYKVNPPIRSHFDKETLWHGITNRGIDIIESDHAPHTFDEKNVDFDVAPCGIPGVETMYPLFLAKVKQGALSMNNLITLICERPAKIMNLPKGKIEIGKDADFIIVDYKNTTKITSENLHSKCGWSPFEGFPAIFPSSVFIRGQQVIDDFELVEKPGVGTHVFVNNQN